MTRSTQWSITLIWGGVLSHVAGADIVVAVGVVLLFAALVRQRVRERSDGKMEFSERMYDDQI